MSPVSMSATLLTEESLRVLRRDYVSSNGAANLLGVTPSYVRVLVSTKYLQHSRLVQFTEDTRPLLFHLRDEVATYLQQHPRVGTKHRS